MNSSSRNRGRGIVEVVDEVLSNNPDAAGLAINWQCFGSNGHETADYSKGVLERFTRRAPSDWVIDRKERLPFGNIYVKSVTNPRRVFYFFNPHFAKYFDGFKSVNAAGMEFAGAGIYPVAADKIVVNHYYTKSREEYAKTKMSRGWACSNENPYSLNLFEIYDRNEVFDDGILKYRAARAQNFSLPSDDERLKRVTGTLTRILSDYSAGKKFSLETALTCRALSNQLGLKTHEEVALAAILNSLDEFAFVEANLLIRELPKLLCLPYSDVKYLREAAVQVIQQLKDAAHINRNWQHYVEPDYLTDILKIGG